MLGVYCIIKTFIIYFGRRAGLDLTGRKHDDNGDSATVHNSQSLQNILGQQYTIGKEVSGFMSYCALTN